MLLCDRGYRRARRHGVSELIATLLLIALAVAAAVLLYAFASGLLGSYTSGGPSSLVSASGQMTIAGSTSPTGVLTLNLRNEGSQSIKNIGVTCGETVE